MDEWIGVVFNLFYLNKLPAVFGSTLAHGICCFPCVVHSEFLALPIRDNKTRSNYVVSIQFFRNRSKSIASDCWPMLARSLQIWHMLAAHVYLRIQHCERYKCRCATARPHST